MFKKVKALFISGLLFLGMVAPSFADSNCIINGAGKHMGNKHSIVKEDRISQDQIDKMVKELDDEKYYVAEHDKMAKVVRVYKDFDMDGKKDKDDCGVSSLVEEIHYEANNEVGNVDKGWGGVELTPETGDVFALGGVAVASVAAGVLALVNKKNKKDK